MVTTDAILVPNVLPDTMPGWQRLIDKLFPRGMCAFRGEDMTVDENTTVAIISAPTVVGMADRRFPGKGSKGWPVVTGYVYNVSGKDWWLCPTSLQTLQTDPALVVKFGGTTNVLESSTVCTNGISDELWTKISDTRIRERQDILSNYQYPKLSDSDTKYLTEQGNAYKQKWV